MRPSTGLKAWGAAMLVVACSKPTPTVQITVPHGYHGPVLIVFDEPAGERLRWTGNTLRLGIPSSGVLKIRDGMGTYPETWIPAAFTDDGQRLPIPLGGSDPPFDPDLPARKDGLGLYGGTNTDNRVMSYWVGTRSEYRRPQRWESVGRAVERALGRS